MIYMQPDDIGTIAEEQADTAAAVENALHTISLGIKIKALVNLITSLTQDELEEFIRFIRKSQANGIIDSVLESHPNVPEDFGENWLIATQAILDAHGALAGLGQL